MKTILVVDDEAPVRHALRAVLEAEGWRVREAADIREMASQIELGDVDLVTLDLGLGGTDTLRLARDLRTRENLPVVVISGRAAPFERAKWLEAGADDYVVKPFDNREVAIRIRRVLEHAHSQPNHSKRMSFDHSSVDLNRRVIVHRDGRKEELTGIETRLLELFLNHPAQVLSRNDINQALHGRDWSPYDRTIDSHVARLRRKIEPENIEAPTVIRSVRGVGYVFTADVMPVTEPL